jgi:hypothetical protein
MISTVKRKKKITANAITSIIIRGSEDVMTGTQSPFDSAVPESNTDVKPYLLHGAESFLRN